MRLFKRSTRFTLNDEQSAIIFSNGTYETFLSKRKEGNSSRYLTAMVSWLLAGQDSDARLLYQAIDRKFAGKMEKFLSGTEKGELDGSLGTDNL
jgi:hypothetical protein